MIIAHVVRTERVTPTMMRVTLGGEQLERFVPSGFDQWFRLFLPDGGDASFALPKKINLLGYVQYLAMPKATRPVMRNYTVRAFRAEPAELDIDFVAHGDNGPASRFAVAARADDTVALIDQGVMYAPVEGVDWQLLAADESGLPAVLGILRDMPRDAVGHAFIEIPDAADAQPVEAPAGMQLHWLPRPHGQRPGSLALAAVQGSALPAGSVYAYVVGEQSLPTSLRRWLVNERGVPKANVTFSGFWKA
jgi:NADPH-dependent ferric siderophore reductase